MRSDRPKPWHALVLFTAVAVLAVALTACGSSSSGTATSTGSSSPEPAATEEPAEGGSAEAASETEEESEGSESELEGIMRVQIFGKFGGNRHEFDVTGGTCKIVKINTTPAEVKAGGKAILDHERNASVLAKPAGGATMKECESALESAIG